MVKWTMSKTRLLVILAVLTLYSQTPVLIEGQEIEASVRNAGYQDLTPLLIHLQAISQLLSAQNMQMNSQNGLLRLLHQQLSTHSATASRVSQSSSFDMAAIEKHVILAEDRLAMAMKKITDNIMLALFKIEEKLNDTISRNLCMSENTSSTKRLPPENPVSTQKDRDARTNTYAKIPVFHVESENGQYMLTFTKAQAQCELLGGTIATPIQMQAAHDDGLDVCRWGWVSDGTLRMPIRYPRRGCADEESRAVVVADARNITTTGTLNSMADVYCFKF